MENLGGAKQFGTGVVGMAEIRETTYFSPPPAQEVVQEGTIDTPLFRQGGVDLDVGESGSLTPRLFPPGVVFELMLGNRLDAIRLLRAFSITNELLADQAVDQRTIGDGQVQENHLSPQLSEILRNLRADVDFAGVPQEGGISAEAAVNLIRRNAVNSITSTGGTITVTNPTAGVFNLEATGESEAVGSPTSLSHSLAGRVLTTTLGRSGQSDLTADVTLSTGEGGGNTETVDVSVSGQTLTVDVDGISDSATLPSGSGSGVSSVDLGYAGEILTVDVDGVSDTVRIPTGSGTADGVITGVSSSKSGSTVTLTFTRSAGLPNLTSSFTVDAEAPESGISAAEATVLINNALAAYDFDSEIESYLTANPPDTGVTEARATTIAEGRINNLVERWARQSGFQNVPIAKIQTALNSFLTQANTTSRIQSVARGDRDNIVNEEVVYDHVANIIQEAS